METRTDLPNSSPRRGAPADTPKGLPSGTETDSRWSSRLKKRLIDPLLTSRHPHWFNSRGLGIGLAAGFACPIGTQFFVITALRVLMRFNSILALGVSLVSNPFTVMPLYYVYYRLGSFILGQPVSMSMGNFEGSLSAALASGYFWDTIPALLNLGKDVIIRWCVSAAILAVTFGTLGYVVAWKIQERFGGSTDEKDVSYDKERGPHFGRLDSPSNE